MATVDGASVPTSLAAARNKVFMQAKKGSPWHKALRKRDCVELKRRLTEDPSAGPQLLRQVYRQNTALHIAVRQGCADLVAEIVENLFGDAGKIEVDDGNDEFTLIQLLDAVNDEEVTATTIAAFYHNEKIFDILQTAKSKYVDTMERESSDDTTVLMSQMMTCWNRKEVVAQLLRWGSRYIGSCQGGHLFFSLSFSLSIISSLHKLWPPPGSKPSRKKHRN